MTAIVHETVALHGLEPRPVKITVRAEPGLGYQVKGLPETSARELRVRIAAALTAGLCLDTHRQLDISVEGLGYPAPHLDLPIALCVLAALGEIPADVLKGRLFLGELSLGGEIRPVRGVLPLLNSKWWQAIVPADNAHEAGLVAPEDTLYARNLRDVVAHLRGENLPLVGRTETLSVVSELPDQTTPYFYLHTRLGQTRAETFLSAIVKRQSVLLVGPPGSGKTGIARIARDLLPVASNDQVITTTAIHSVAGLVDSARGYVERPFRAPHHSVSETGLIGGGERPRPGEVSLAHGGVLFLDEVTEFRRSSIEALASTLRAGEARIARSKEVVRFPAKPLLIGATSPCPCGYFGYPQRTCHCSEESVKRYLERIPKGLFDVRVDVLPGGAL